MTFALALALAAGLAPSAMAARGLPGEPVTLVTSDSWTIVGRYSPSTEDDRLTFVLLHDGRGRKENWTLLARRMAAMGIGYLALDMRGHGASIQSPPGQPSTWRQFIVTRRDNPYEGIREDIAAAAAFLGTKGVPPEAVALGGADLGSSVALQYAALHPEVAMVFSLSPGLSYHEVATLNAVRAIKDRPMLFVVAEDDRKALAETSILYQFSRQVDGDQNATFIQVPRGHGTRMLAYDRGLIDKILDWMEDPTPLPAESTAPVEGLQPSATPVIQAGPDGGPAPAAAPDSSTEN
ncbi:MAG: alpha/beta fold hydrolase [Elusimicrobia bacterium]|nr:alpha/beta fold hydrolase [Elusimicrobiota bacterium]